MNTYTFYYKLIISSISDHDYKLIIPYHLLGNNFTVKSEEDELVVEAHFFLKNDYEFASKLFEIMSNFDISTNKEHLEKTFHENLYKLREKLLKNDLSSPDYFFTGNQDLFITFFKITETQL